MRHGGARHSLSALPSDRDDGGKVGTLKFYRVFPSVTPGTDAYDRFGNFISLTLRGASKVNPRSITNLTRLLCYSSCLERINKSEIVERRENENFKADSKTKHKNENNKSSSHRGTFIHLSCRSRLVYLRVYLSPHFRNMYVVRGRIRPRNIYI